MFGIISYTDYAICYNIHLKMLNELEIKKLFYILLLRTCINPNSHPIKSVNNVSRLKINSQYFPCMLHPSFLTGNLITNTLYELNWSSVFKALDTVLLLIKENGRLFSFSLLLTSSTCSSFLIQQNFKFGSTNPKNG